MPAVRHARRLAFATVLACAAASAPAFAAEGALDSSFGIDGRVSTSIGHFNSHAWAVTIDPQGRIVAAGDGELAQVALARYNASGGRDPTFGTGGVVHTPIGTGFARANAVAVDPRGGIVVAGVSIRDDFTLVRYRSNGTLDPTFGTHGKAFARLGHVDRAQSMAIDASGRIVVAGPSEDATHGDFALARLTSDGKLDPTFGVGGKVHTPIGGDSGVFSIAIDPQGRIVAGGFGQEGDHIGFALARYTADGSLDPTFGSGGTLTTAIGLYAVAYSVAIDAQGRIVAGGTTLFSSFNGEAALARYTPGGALDPTFGSGGRVILGLGSYWDGFTSLALDAHQRIVAAGANVGARNQAFVLARFSGSGALDPAFSSDGLVWTGMGGRLDAAYAVAIDPEGRIVAAGENYDGSSGDFALARYVGDATWPTVRIVAGPPNDSFVTDATPSFALRAPPGPGSSVRCALDRSPPGPCRSHFATPPLADGAHTLLVNARDGARRATAARSFTVDTRPPRLAIEAAQPSRRPGVARFTLTASEPVRRFCRLDGGRPAACRLRYRSPPLHSGPHRLSVTAIDRAGHRITRTRRFAVAR